MSTPTKCLLDIAEYTNGLPMQKYRPDEYEASMPVIKIKELNQNATDETSEKCSKCIDDKYVVNDGDIIFSWSGTLLVKIWAGGLGGLNQHLFKVTSSKHPKWFYYLWTKKHLEKFQAIAAGKATTMGHIKRIDLEKSDVLIPNAADISVANKEFEPLLDRVIALYTENRELQSLKKQYLEKFFS